jgi:hypothetical protein
MRGGRVTRRIFAALGAYLLAAFVFGRLLVLDREVRLLRSESPGATPRRRLPEPS